MSLVDRLAGPRRLRQRMFAAPQGYPAARDGIFARAWRSLVRAVYRRPGMPVFAHDVVTAPRPSAVNTEIINICNADCSFCGYGKGEDGKAADPRVKGKLKPDVFRHALELYSKGGGGNFTLSPILGEASAHPDWLDLVRQARSYPNITGVNCFTNAILLDRFGSKNILQSGLTHIAISTCLGGPEAYKRLYGVDKYEVVVRNILDLLRTNRELGEPVHIDLCLRMDKPFEPFFASDLYKQLIEVIEPRRILILDDNWDDFRGIVGKESLPVGQEFKDAYADKSVPCYALFRQLMVLTDGTIQACTCRVEPELWAGNIKSHASLEEAWRDPGLERIRREWFAGKLSKCCQQCSHYMPYTNLIEPARPHRVAREAAARVKRAVIG